MNDVINALQGYTKYAEDIVKRLETLTYSVTIEDVYFLKFVAEKIEKHIKNVCNISEIPDNLKNVYIDMICAEFLQFKYSTGQLNDENFSLDDAVSVSLGDASVSFGSDAPTRKFDALMDNLKSGESDLICYRKIRW